MFMQAAALDVVCLPSLPSNGLDDYLGRNISCSVTQKQARIAAWMIT
jgi:hypothetical protein